MTVLFHSTQANSTVKNCRCRKMLVEDSYCVMMELMMTCHTFGSFSQTQGCAALVM